MRRTLLIGAFVFVSVGLLAGPAMAQLRDPFEPLVQPGGQVSDPGIDPPVDGEAPPVVQPSEQVPNTGADSTDWTATAYILMVVGGALVVLGQLYHRPGLREFERR